MSGVSPEAAIQRAGVLISQHRLDQAEQQLRGALAEEPDHALAHAILALCLAQAGKRSVEAISEAKLAVSLAPDESLPHYALAVAYHDAETYKPAIDSAKAAIALDPDDADCYAVLSQANYSLQRYDAALRAAEDGLARDPDHIGCGNLRSLALEKAGRSGDAIANAEATIRRDPDNSFAHASLGHAKLAVGDFRGAQTAFAEALRLNPNDPFARHGMIEAIQSGNWLYRIFYRAYAKLGQLDTRAIFALFFGFWVLMRILDQVQLRYPGAGPIIGVVQLGYIGLALMTWLMTPLFNMTLHFHRFGRHLLSTGQRWQSMFIASFLLTAVATGFLGTVWFGEWSISLAIFWVLMCLPVVSAFNAPPGGLKKILTAASIGLPLLPWVGLAIANSTGDPEVADRWLTNAQLGAGLSSLVMLVSAAGFNRR